MHRILI